MSLKLNDGVYYLLRRLLVIPEGSKVLVCGCDQEGMAASEFAKNGGRVTATFSQNSEYTELQKNLARDEYYRKNRVEVSVHDQLQMYRLGGGINGGSYHYAFLFPAGIGVNVYDNAEYPNASKAMYPDGRSPEVSDTLRYWQISRYHSQYKAPLHMMLLEQAYDAVLSGGYFAAVLPRSWMGSRMRYMRWWSELVAPVAKIQLPNEALEHWAVSNEDSYLYGVTPGETGTMVRVPAPDPEVSSGNVTKFALYIWHKTAHEIESRKNKLHFAKIRYSTFTSKLTGVSDEQIEGTLKTFRKHDWHKYSIRPWLKILEDGNDRKYHADVMDMPTPINSPGEMRTIHVSDTNRPVFAVFPNVEEMKKNPMAVHVKVGPPVRLYAYTQQANAALLDIAARSDISQEEQKKSGPEYLPQFRFNAKLRAKALIDNKDWLLKTLCDGGLVPSILEQDSHRIKKMEKWLNIQLTPVQRMVKVPSEGNGDVWEKMYEDFDVRSAYPELWRMWEERGKRMRLNKLQWLKPFQFEDVVTLAVKTSLWNCNKMGLGKTREELFACLLVGVKKSQIIVPSRLIGIWQTEIETTIANYVRAVQRNWMGEIMRADYQIIQFAKDCLPQNQRTFNIISYENLSRVPKDAVFFKCPLCEFVVCSPYARYKKECEQQKCPQCNHRAKEAVKAYNKLMGFKKFKEKGGLERDSRVVSTGNHDLMNPVMMIAQDNHYEKIKTKIVQQRRWDSEKREEVTVQVVIKEEKPLHLRWTFAQLLRNSYKRRIAEESNYVNNPDTNRSTVFFHCRARQRHPMTGTPVRGYPRSVVNVLTWTNKYEVFPEYRTPGAPTKGMKKFEKKYGYYIQREGKPPKLVPKINQPEMFQQEIAPLMLRHLSHEPEVAKYFPPRTANIEVIRLPMDKNHAVYYQQWLDKFAEWWKMKRIEEDKQLDAGLNNDLLVKLGYLINASTIPHFMLEKLSGEGAIWAKIIGPYEQNQEQKTMVAKFKKATELVEKYIALGDKTLFGTWRRANLVLGRHWSKAHKPKIHSVCIDGTMSNKVEEKYGNRSQKQYLVDQFCYSDYHVLWATIPTLKEGFNIPQANHAVIVDYTWEPADWEQFIARMLRPAQKKPVDATFLVHEGTADEYVCALSMIKHYSAREGVDFEGYEFNASMVPDFQQYANAIVTGKAKELKSRMWNIVEELKRQIEEEEGE